MRLCMEAHGSRFVKGSSLLSSFYGIVCGLADFNGIRHNRSGISAIEFDVAHLVGISMESVITGPAFPSVHPIAYVLTSLQIPGTSGIDAISIRCAVGHCEQRYCRRICRKTGPG